MRMRIFLTGKNGQVGFELQRALAPLGEITAAGQDECDLADPEAIRRLIRKIQPDIIVNPAAYTAVDKAEAEAELALAVNGTAPQVLGEEAARIGALVVHYCTDYVFDGGKRGFYAEEDPPNPQNVYGRTKLAGTEAIRQSTRRHLVFRTSWVFGGHGNNFAKTILRLAAERDTLKVVADQFGAPTSAPLIADVTAQVIGRYRRQRGDGFPYGLYNLAASGETTWCDYAQAIVTAPRHAGKELRLTPENIRPIPSADYLLPALRPANSRLATGKLQTTFGLRLPPWQEGLSHVLQQIF